MNKETLGTIFALIAAVISGIAIPINKLFIVSIDPLVFTAIRAVLIGIGFFAISMWQSVSTHEKFRKVSWGYLLGIAVIGGALAFYLFFSGLKLTTASSSAFLQKTIPLYVALLAFLFIGEKITRKMWYAIGIMLIGTIAIYASSGNPAQLWENPSLGNIMIIAATVLWAVEAVIAKKAMIIGESNFTVTFARMFIGGIMLLGLVVILGKTSALTDISVQQWTNILISTGILFAYVLFWYAGIKLINVSKATSLLLLAPVISAIFGIVIFSEQISALQMLGSTLILIGAYFVSGVRSEFQEKI